MTFIAQINYVISFKMRLYWFLPETTEHSNSRIIVLVNADDKESAKIKVQTHFNKNKKEYESLTSVSVGETIE